MLGTYNIKILSENDSVTVIDTASKTFQITCRNNETVYSAEDIQAVIVKTMDTGPSVEDMYAEIHINDAIYIILSESPQYNDAIIKNLNAIVPLNLALFIEASMYHFNKSFVLYQKTDLAVETEDCDEKRIAILEASIKLLQETKQSAGLTGFMFAIMSFCPMYLMYGKGENKDMLVNLSGISENLIPICTSLDRCPNEDKFEKRKLPANEYVKILVSLNADAMINFNTDCQIKISFQQLKGILLPLIILREDPALQEGANSKESKKGKGFFSKLFKK